MKDSPIKTSGFRQALRATSAVAREKVGCIRITDDGRKFRYAKNGATLLPIGVCTVAAAIAAQHIDATIASANSNGTQVVVTVTAGTALAENQLAGGYLQVNDVLLEGNQYRIESNTAMTSAGTSVTISLTDPIVGWDTTTQVTLAHNPFSGVIIAATPEAMPTGITPISVPANHYFWVQTGGPLIALTAGTPAVGSMLTHSTTDGAVAAVNATFDIDQPIIGIAWGTAGVATEYKPVYLTID